MQSCTSIDYIVWHWKQIRFFMQAWNNFQINSTFMVVGHSWMFVCCFCREEIMLATALYEEPPSFQTRTGFDLRRIIEDQVRQNPRFIWSSKEKLIILCFCRYMFCIYEFFINHYLQDNFSHYLSKVLFVVIQNLWVSQ